MNEENVLRNVLEYIEVNSTDMRKDAFRHWQKTILFLIKHSGESQARILLLMRSSIGIDYRYLNDYLNTLQEWGVINVTDDIIKFIGVPKNKEIKEKPKQTEQKTESIINHSNKDALDWIEEMRQQNLTTKQLIDTVKMIKNEALKDAILKELKET